MYWPATNKHITTTQEGEGEVRHVMKNNGRSACGLVWTQGEGRQCGRIECNPNPLVCVCEEPEVGAWGQCARCLRKPLALFRVLR